jgi:hypothetical protein
MDLSGLGIDVKLKEKKEKKRRPSADKGIRTLLIYNPLDVMVRLYFCLHASIN